MTRRKALSLAVALSVMSALLPVGAVAAPIVFSDGTFDPADWEETHLLIGNGGTVTTLQLGTGGNPDEYRMVILQVNGADAAGSSAVWAFYRRLGADYDPQTQGAIESLDYSEDSVLIVPPPFSGYAGQAAGPALRQDGTVYVAYKLTTPESTWTHKSLEDLTADDFREWAGPATAHPDFSAAGSPIEFGFFRANSAPSYGYTTGAGIDNFRIVIPEPATLALLTLGGLALIRPKRR